MLKNYRCLALLLVLGATPSWAAADQVRFHFVARNGGTTMTQVPAGPDGAVGELKRGLGLVAAPYPKAVRPTQLVTFRHPYTCRNATVPMLLPACTPRLEHRTDRIVYIYDDYTVEGRFLPDGSIDVVYKSGVFRPLPF